MKEDGKRETSASSESTTGSAGETPQEHLAMLAGEIHGSAGALGLTGDHVVRIGELCERIQSGSGTSSAGGELYRIIRRSGHPAAKDLGDRLWPLLEALDAVGQGTEPAEGAGEEDGGGQTGGGPVARPDDVPVDADAPPVQATPGDAGQCEGLSLSSLEISFWNRSYECEPDAAHAAQLAASIGTDGLAHAILLVRFKDNPTKYAVLCGANRVVALRSLRGEDGVLHPGEYRIREDLTEDDPACMRIAADENAIRRKPSPYELARLAKRVSSREDVTDALLTKTLRVSRQELSALRHLPSLDEQLPACWRRDLRATKSEGDRAGGPAITISHLRIVVAPLTEFGVTEEFKAILEDAAAKHWTTEHLRRVFREAVSNLEKKASGDDAGEHPAETKDPTEDDTEKPQPVEGAGDGKEQPPGGNGGEENPKPGEGAGDEAESPTPEPPPGEGDDGGPGEGTGDQSPEGGEVWVEDTDIDCVLLALLDASGCAGLDEEIRAVVDEASRKIVEIQDERAGEGKA